MTDKKVPEEYKDEHGRVLARRVSDSLKTPYVSLPRFSRLALERFPELRLKDFLSPDMELTLPPFAYGLFELRLYELKTGKNERSQFRTVICVVEEPNPEF